MVWGRSHARRACPPRADTVAELEAPTTPPIARCARCDTPVIMAGGKLPKGWVEVHCEAVCPDCAPAALREARRPVRPKAKAGPNKAVSGKRRHVDIGPKGVRFTGCRIGAEVIHGMAALDIRAGASAPLGRDERVQFLLDASGLDELIIELSAIRKGLPNG